ncbi:MAG: transglutaminase family protein, partial [Kofleriaceae bacterium]
MEPSPGLGRFCDVVLRDDFALDHAALLIGAWDYPERNIETYRDQLDAIASYAAPEVARATGGIGRARAISDCLFERLGFCGNTDDYYDHSRLGVPARAASRSADRVIAISDAVARMLRETGGLPEERVRRVYY